MESLDMAWSVSGRCCCVRGRAAACRSYKFRETVVEGIPKEWGRLVNASSFSDGSAAMFFEASDGTIRRVTAKFFSSDVQWGPRVVAVPRP